MNHEGTREPSVMSRAHLRDGPPAQARLVLADSHAILRLGVRSLLYCEPRFEIVEVADLDGLTGIPDVEDDPPAEPIVRRRPPLSSASAQEPKKSQRDKNRDKRMLSICTGC